MKETIMDQNQINFPLECTHYSHKLKMMFVVFCIQIFMYAVHAPLCTCSSLTFVRSIFLLLYSILSHIVCVYKQFSDQMAVLLVFKKSVIS